MRDLIVKYTGRYPLPIVIILGDKRLTFSEENKKTNIVKQCDLFELIMNERIEFEILGVVNEGEQNAKPDIEDNTTIKEVVTEQKDTETIQEIVIEKPAKRRGNPNWIKKDIDNESSTIS